MWQSFFLGLFIGACLAYLALSFIVAGERGDGPCG